MQCLTEKSLKTSQKMQRSARNIKKKQRVPCQSTAWMNLAAESESEPAKHRERPFAPVNFSICSLDQGLQGLQAQYRQSTIFI